MLIVRILDESLGLFKDEVAERQTAREGANKFLI